MALRKLLLWLLVASAFLFLFAGAAGSKTELREYGQSSGLAEFSLVRSLLPEAGRTPVVGCDIRTILLPGPPLNPWSIFLRPEGF